MRRNLGLFTVALSAACLAALPRTWAQQNPPAAKGATAGARSSAQPAPADPKAAELRLERLLQLWEKQSARLKTLDVTIHRVDKENSPAWEGEERFVGRAILKSPNLAWLNFEKIVTDEKKQKVRVPFEQIRCTGTEVWQYRSDTRQIYIFPLEKEDRQKALEEGPLPFLFNMRAGEAKERYRMQLLKEDDKSYVIGVLPLKEIDQEGFSKAFLQLDRKYLLPTRIFLVSPDGQSTKDFTLADIKPNAAVSDENFQGKLLPKWTVVRNPDAQGKPAQRGARGATSRPRLPALRGGSPSERR